MIEVIFLRHGIAMDQEDWDGDDRSRPLTKEGADRTKSAVRGLRALKVRADILWSSPLKRARQTAEIAKTELPFTSKIELIEDLSPEAAPDALIARLADVKRGTIVFCVGHEPHLSTTISSMISGKTAASVDMKKAGACSIRFTAGPKSGAGVLQWLVPPKILRLLGE